MVKGQKGTTLRDKNVVIARNKDGHFTVTCCDILL